MKKPMSKRNGHDNPTMQDSQTPNTALQETGISDGMQDVPEGLGSQVQRLSEGTKLPKETTEHAIIPANGTQPVVCEASAAVGLADVVGEDDHYIKLARNARASLTKKRDLREKAEIAKLPEVAVATANHWLVLNDLVYSAGDQEFWRNFGYVLSSLESFSIEAVISALEMVVIQANYPVRRSAFYAELRAARSLKRIRDAELRIKTQRVVARRVLAANVPAKDRLHLNIHGELAEAREARLRPLQKEHDRLQEQYEALMQEHSVGPTKKNKAKATKIHAKLQKLRKQGAWDGSFVTQL